MVDPSRSVANTVPPPVHIEEVKADRNAHLALQNLSLPALTRDLEIDYTALSLVNPAKGEVPLQTGRVRHAMEGCGHAARGVLYESRAGQIHIPCHRMQQRRRLE